MKLTNTERVIAGGVLAVLAYMQTEISISHQLHDVIGVIIVFLAAIGINGHINSKEELPPEYANIPIQSQPPKPDVNTQAELNNG